MYVLQNLCYIQRHVEMEVGESCLLSPSWMSLCARGTGVASARTAGKAGRQPGSNGQDKEKFPWEKCWVCWQEGAGSCRCDGRRISFPGLRMNAVELVQPRSQETCWLVKEGLQEITCLAWCALAGRGFMPPSGLGFPQ